MDVVEGMTDEAILDRILQHEGGFVDHIHDRGRATNFGITQATLSDWRGKPVSTDDVRQLTVEEAKAIYRSRYIKPFDALELEPMLKAHVVDIAVNSGVTTARALLGLAQGQTQRPVSVQLVIERLKHYARIVKARPSQVVFLQGWISRAVSYL
jgi:lysozyme family protein